MHTECYILVKAFDVEGRNEELLCVFDKESTAQKAVSLRPEWKGARILKAYTVGGYLLGRFSLLSNGMPRKINIINETDKNRLDLCLKLQEKKKELDKIVSKLTEKEIQLLQEFKDNL